MNDSILDTIKKMLGITSEETAFDVDIITLINAAFMTLKQLGVGPTAGFSITDLNSIWSDFTDNEAMLGSIQSYIYMKVRVVFDPPSSSVLTAMESAIKELEWRMNVEVDPSYDEEDS